MQKLHWNSGEVPGSHVCFLWPHLLNWDLLSGWLPAFTAHVGTRLTHLYFCPLSDAIPPTLASCPGGVVCSTNLPENKLKFVVPEDKGRNLCFYMDSCALPMGTGDQYLADTVSLLCPHTHIQTFMQTIIKNNCFQLSNISKQTVAWDF